TSTVLRHNRTSRLPRWPPPPQGETEFIWRERRGAVEFVSNSVEPQMLSEFCRVPLPPRFFIDRRGRTQEFYGGRRRWNRLIRSRAPSRVAVVRRRHSTLRRA